jgi:hypothetical protein
MLNLRIVSDFKLKKESFRKVGLVVILITFLINCSESKEHKINLYIYTDFINPLKTYIALKEDLVNTNYLDSLKVIGRPLFEQELVIQLDTPRVMSYGFDFDTLNANIADKIGTIKNVVDIENIRLKNKSGFYMLLGQIAELKMAQGYFEPEIFLPQPEVYYHNGRSAVKLELYYKHGTKKKLIAYIRENIEKYSDANEFSRYYIGNIDFEIDKK